MILFACNGNGTESMPDSDSTYTSTTLTDTTPADNTDMATLANDDISKSAITFIHQAGMSGNMEITMAQNAMEKASSDEVKNLAKTIADQHTELNNKLKDIAKSKNINFPVGVTSTLQDEMTEMTSKKGSDFDRAYLQWVIKEHQKDIDDFKRASAESKDEQVSQFASTAVPILQQHLDAAKAIKF